MALDPAQNFVRGTVDASISAGDTTISVTDASVFPDPSSEGDYNLVLWDGATYNRPGADPDVEIVRVTARDTGNNDLTVTRGQESTADADHPDTSVLQMAWTAKIRDDVQTEAIGTAVDDTDSPYTTQSDAVIAADTSSGAVTVTLATADVSNNTPITVVNVSGSNAVTVNTEGGETIDPDGDSSKTLSKEGWALTLTPDGSNWDSNLNAEYEEATITSETAVFAETDGNITIGSPNSWTSPSYGTENRDERNEFDSSNDEFSPDKDGLYAVAFGAQFSSPSDGDRIQARIQNTTDGTTVAAGPIIHAGGTTTEGTVLSLPAVELLSTKTYEFQLRDADSAANLDANNGYLSIRSAFRET